MIFVSLPSRDGSAHEAVARAELARRTRETAKRMHESVGDDERGGDGREQHDEAQNH